MTLTQALLGFTAVAALITIIPGLDTALVLRASLNGDRRQAFATAVGIALGALVWGVAAAVGASALLAASRYGYKVLTLVGAGYLVWLGIGLVRKVFGPSGGELDAVPAAPRRSTIRCLATGMWTNLLNPKIGVFYLATIPQFIPEGASPLGMGLLLAGIHDVLGLAWFTLIILGASYARRWLASARSSRIIDAVTGSVLVGFGLTLALESR